MKRSIKVALIVTGVIAIVAGGPAFAIIVVPLFGLWGIYTLGRFILTDAKWH
ncbi:MAG: hypothetical protein U5K33_01110 [Halofilum sp. (in: g-proteobacteria)]|nr:hypothetical protein [Halofilum sp. (in: g-proteobacteria)]